MMQLQKISMREFVYISDLENDMSSLEIKVIIYES